MRALVISLLVGCVQTPASEPDPTPPQPLPPPAAPWLANVHGDYYVRTTVDVTGDIPSTTLHAYADAPGTTMIALAGTGDLPANIAAHVPAWFDGVLRNNGLTLLTALATAEALEHPPAQVELESTLVIHNESVHHRIDAIYLDPMTLTERYVVGKVDGEIATAATTATFTPDSSGGSMTFADHLLVISVGDYRYQQAEAKQPLRELFGEATGCPFVAIGVANACDPNGGCNAYIPTFDQLCESGLDHVFADTRAELAMVQIRITGGTAQLATHSFAGAWVAGQDNAIFHATPDAQAPVMAALR